jgi:hypothetical protein
MRVGIDEPGADDLAGRIDLQGCLSAVYLAEGGDPAVLDPDTASVERVATAVNDSSVLDQDIEFHGLFPHLSIRPYRL